MSTTHNESAIKEWAAIVAYHREGLAKAETQLKKLQSVEVLLTEAEIKARVLAIAPKDPLWKKAVVRGLVNNVSNILDECYSSLLEVDLPNRTKFLERIGTRKSLKWQLFKLDVIRRLKADGSFAPYTGEAEYDIFDDTAGGCDEVVGTVAMELLKEPIAAN